MLLPQLPTRAAYLGWSLGGAVATALAARYPARVSALVSVATNPCFVSRTSWPAAMPPVLFEQFSAHLQRGWSIFYWSSRHEPGESEPKWL